MTIVAMPELNITDSTEAAGFIARAVCSNDLAQTDSLLKRHPERARHDFYVACACGELDFVREKLATDPELALRPGGPNDWVPLLYACFSRFLRRGGERADRIVEIARLLLKAGADPNSHYVEHHGEHSHGQTCLYAAAGIANRPELTRLLLDAGADVDERVPEPAKEVLYHAAEFKDVTCLRMILEAKPDPEFVSYCLGRALDFESDAVFVFLEFGADPRARNPFERSMSHLHKAVLQPRSEQVVRALLEHGADPNALDAEGRSAYALAVRFGEKNLARVLQESGADVTLASDEDRLIGTLCSGERSPRPGDPEPDGRQLCRAARRGDVPAIRRLLAAGADPDAKTDNPPLHSAGYAGHPEAARALLDAGASLTLVNDYGGSPLGATLFGSLNCCDPEGGPGTLLPEEIPGDHAGVVELLLERGAPLPEECWGSEPCQMVLRRHGVREGGS